MGREHTPRRRFPRYHTSLEVIIYDGKQATRSRITGISRSGCLVFPPLAAQENPEVRLSFRLADDMPEIHCRGEILYSINDKGTGIGFTEISIYNQALITQYFEG